MTDIVKDLHTTRHPLAFPNIIARLCEAAGISYRAPSSNEAVPKVRPITTAVMENIRYPPHQPPPPRLSLNNTLENVKTKKFYESILAQHASYGLRLRDIEVKQNDMWVMRQILSDKEFPTIRQVYRIK
ncbi:hypothetical protein PIB30_087230 [Stylosanthes scabra]|uniref:Uncharacterized protein n=1 Tax=Stylosanthes scabra TaxID=79078 RepID=A0ABU6WRR0_9FABA|nr:hypothetical protein [Stylosanthes scabra]